MTNNFLEGAVISASPSQTIDRYGNTISEATAGPCLLLKEFLPSALFACAVKIHPEKGPGLIALPVKIISGKDTPDIPLITVVFVDKNELLGRLCLKGIKKRRNKAEQNDGLIINYIQQKGDYFLRLPKILEQAKHILTSHQQSSYKLEADEQAFLTPQVLTKCIRRYYKHLDNGIGKNFPYNILHTTPTHKILGAINGENKLDLSFIKKDPLSQERVLGSGTYARVTTQWHVPSGNYLAYKCANDLTIDKRIANKSIEWEYQILLKLHSNEIASTLALPPVPKILHKGIACIASSEEINVGYMTKICGTDLFSLLYAIKDSKKKSPYNFCSDIKTTMRICYSLLETVAYAHSMGIYHTDISTTNILIEFSHEESEPSIKLLITDWGGARTNQNKKPYKLVSVPPHPYFLKEDASACNKAKNKPILFFDICQRIDVYQIGFILFLLFTNGEEHPYPTEVNYPMVFNRIALEERGYSLKLIALLEGMLDTTYCQRPLAQEALDQLL